MTSKKNMETNGGASAVRTAGDDSPQWANGLKQLYDSVVEEPLPDSFKDLLSQFDEGDAGADDRSPS